MVLTANPDFLSLATAELRAAAPGARLEAELAPGVWRVALPGDFFELAERWRRERPIFVRHICPVQVALPLAAAADLVAPILAELADLVDPALPFSVQTRTFETAVKPFDINRPLADALHAATGAPLDVRQPQQILSVVIHGDVVMAGFSLAAHNLSDWAGGARRFAREKGQISRAEFKLLEALETFDIPLPPYGVALDLGAAPGGWTRVLARREQYVTAVDPAALHPNVTAVPTIRHKRMLAESYLAEGPDTYDLIVNDMRLDARDSARLMVAFAPYLYRHGHAIMTFKLPTEQRESVLDHAFNILRAPFHIAGARQLFHNRSEVTVHLTPG